MAIVRSGGPILLVLNLDDWITFVVRTRVLPIASVAIGHHPGCFNASHLAGRMKREEFLRLGTLRDYGCLRTA